MEDNYRECQTSMNQIFNKFKYQKRENCSFHSLNIHSVPFSHKTNKTIYPVTVGFFLHQ
jgi:hypothetical protein